MKDRKYLYLLVLISVVILTTLSIQAYWNYKNYKESKSQLIADVQTSLDQSVEDYFTQRAKENTLGIFYNGNINDGALKGFFDRVDLLNKDESSNNSLKNVDVSGLTGIRVIKGADKDSLDRFEEFLKLEQQKSTYRFPPVESDTAIQGAGKITETEQVSISSGKLSNLRFRSDSTSFRMKQEVSNITSKIVLSMTDDTIDLNEVDRIFRSNLESKKINLNHQMLLRPEKTSDSTVGINLPFKATANTSLIKNGQTLSVHYGNLTMVVLKRNLTGILLSFILVASVIFCLFYLLIVINNQKELSSMKNDLISNITHEFKTPIATAGAALEGIKNFTATGDTEKTDRYLDMGREQLSKLNIMVEKLLETATLDSKDLALQKTFLDLSEVLESSVTKFKDQTGKSIKFHLETDQKTTLMADQFHLENAINNLIDNAIKYGGDQIDIHLDQVEDSFLIQVRDNGTSLDAKHTKRLFEKFYRVGNGNRHNVKGFGIGLFYTKTIIEKHGGQINVSHKPSTTFKIQLPYE